tara:strand:+ start:271 stop:1788 length:1518 start_codon:yes stop_codon:yes gene_type:complete
MATYDSIKYKSTAIQNLNDTGTEGSKVAVGTTGQRGSTTGQFRFNSTTGKFEGYGASSFAVLEAYPSVTSVGLANITETQIAADYDLVITGTNFFAGAVVTFIGNDATPYTAPTTTVDSSTQITARVPTTVTNANEPFDVKVTNSSNLSHTLENAFNINAKPVWTTAVGTVATITDSATGTHATLVASDSEGDTIAYTETGATNITGAGLALNSSTGAITGDPTDVGSSTTVSFTGRATADGQTTDRSFNIIIQPSYNGSSSANWAGSPAQIKSNNGGVNPAEGIYWYANAGYDGGNAFQAFTTWERGDDEGMMIISQKAFNSLGIISNFTDFGTASTGSSGTMGHGNNFRIANATILSNWTGDTNNKSGVGMYTNTNIGSDMGDVTNLQWIQFDVTPAVFKNMFDNSVGVGEFVGTLTEGPDGTNTGGYYWSKYNNNEYSMHLQMSNQQYQTAWNGNNYMEYKQGGTTDTHGFFVQSDGQGSYGGGVGNFPRIGFFFFVPNNTR